MNPQEQFCPNNACPATGKVGAGNIGVFSQEDGRYVCKECDQTFSETKGTALYRIKKDHETFTTVVTLLAHGCPRQAIVAAFKLDPRTVRSWEQKAGLHCQEVHEHMMETHPMDLGQVQADEIRVKAQGGVVWLAMALMVTTRLWLGGVVSQKRDKHLVRALADMVKRWALCRDLLIAVDGFSAYVDAFRKAFRTPVKDKKGPGRPRLWEWPNVAVVQVVKKRTKETFSVTRRVALGCEEMVKRLLHTTQNGGQINTSYIERLNGTFRQRIALLVRRSRHLSRLPETITAAMYLVGCVYNFCTYHDSLSLPLWVTERRIHWVKRTPAIAAGLTDHRWSVYELLTFKVPPPPYVPPKRRGRPPKNGVLGAAA